MIIFSAGASILKGLGMAFLLIGAFSHIGGQSSEKKTGVSYACLGVMFPLSGFVNPTMKTAAGF